MSGGAIMGKLMAVVGETPRFEYCPINTMLIQY